MSAQDTLFPQFHSSWLSLRLWTRESRYYSTQDALGSGDGSMGTTRYRTTRAAGKQIRMGTEGDLEAYAHEDHGRIQKHLNRSAAGAEAKRCQGNDESEDEVGDRVQDHSWDSFSSGAVGAMAGLEQDSE